MTYSETRAEVTFTADTPVVDVPARITSQAFKKFLVDVGSPMASTADAGYQVIVDNKVDPLFLLAVAWHESNAATNPAAIVVQFNTNNPGNCRSTRTGGGTVITTPRGAFVKYPSWVEGWRDLAFRLIDPNYVYAQGGCTTPNKIIPKFAPATDNNDPVGYLGSVLSFMEAHADIASGGAPIVSTLWYPIAKRATTPYQNDGASNGRTFPSTVTDVVMHHTDGSYQSAVSYFEQAGRANGTSAHFVISRAGEVTQLVGLDAIAWHAGSWPENVKSIGIEHEQSQLNGVWQDWPDALLNASAALLTWLKQQMTAGFNVYPHKQFTSTTCPGDLPINEIVKRMGGTATTPATATPPADTPRWFPETRHYIAHGFKAFYESHADALQLFGFPLSEEFTDAAGVTVQWFERARFEWHPGFTGNLWGVQLGRLGADGMANDHTKFPAAFADAKAPS